MTVAVLALQGDFAAHIKALAARGIAARAARRVGEIESAEAVVLAGGESTTMLRLLEGTGIGEALRRCAAARVPIFATCAGMILLASKVTNPSQPSLGILDVEVERNGYGRQLDSAVAAVVGEPGGPWPKCSLEGVFIRAPRVTRWGTGVEILARRGRDPVVIRQDRILAVTFHPELTMASPVVDLFIAGFAPEKLVSSLRGAETADGHPDGANSSAGRRATGANCSTESADES